MLTRNALCGTWYRSHSRHSRIRIVCSKLIKLSAINTYVTPAQKVRYSFRTFISNVLNSFIKNRLTVKLSKLQTPLA